MSSLSFFDEDTVDVLLVGGGHALLPTLTQARSWTAAGHRVTLVDPHRYLGTW